MIIFAFNLVAHNFQSSSTRLIHSASNSSTEFLGGETPPSPQHSMHQAPHFFLFGIERSATASIHHLLRSHPDICGKTTKSLNFFKFEALYAKGFKYYEQLFSRCRQNKYLVDASAVFHDSRVIERLQIIYSDAVLASKKFILIVREPISREFSFYRYKLQCCYDYVKDVEAVGYIPGLIDDEIDVIFGRTACETLFPNAPASNWSGVFDKKPLTFREYYAAGLVVKEHGNYFDLLRMWSQVIRRENIFIISMQTLIKHTTDTMARIQRFLGLSVGWGNNVTMPHLNSASRMGVVLDCQTKKELSDLYTKSNADFIRLVQGSPSKPAAEPFFPTFEDIECADDEGGEERDTMDSYLTDEVKMCDLTSYYSSCRKVACLQEILLHATIICALR